MEAPEKPVIAAIIPEPHFGDRLNELLDLAAIPTSGRKAWLERKYSVAKRTPTLWLSGQIPRYKKLKEIAVSLSELAGLDETPDVTELWLMTGKRPNQNKIEFETPQNAYSELDHYTKSIILKEILIESEAMQIDLHALDRNYVNQIISTLNAFVLKKGDEFVRSSEFKAILTGQLEQARQDLL